MLRLSPPVRFLVIILGIWTGARVIFWTPLVTITAPIFDLRDPFAVEAPSSDAPVLSEDVSRTQPFQVAPTSTRHFDWQEFEPGHRRVLASVPQRQPISRRRLFQSTSPVQPNLARQFAPFGDRRPRINDLPPATATSTLARDESISTGGPATTIVEMAQRQTPWRLSAWMLWRDGAAAPTLARRGTLGSSQAGMRVQHRLGRVGDMTLHASGRLSQPLETQRGGEGAIGLAVRPSRHLPIEIMLDRRIALDSGGRNAWSLGIAGGIDRQRLPLGLELDGYAQAGVVGANRRDLYGEMAMTVSRPVALSDQTTLSLGGGAFASTQPGVSRLDIGPQATLRVPTGGANMRITAGWRQRIAGDADPGSGPAISIGTDF